MLFEQPTNPSPGQISHDLLHVLAAPLLLTAISKRVPETMNDLLRHACFNNKEDMESRLMSTYHSTIPHRNTSTHTR